VYVQSCKNSTHQVVDIFHFNLPVFSAIVVIGISVGVINVHIGNQSIVVVQLKKA
jgi:hypothetical protein